MDPITTLMIPSLAGGVALAFLLARLHRGATSHGLVVPSSGQLSTDMINIAQIRVIGLGGLGLVVVCAAVAIDFPMVGLSMAAGFTLGTLLAAALILRRRRRGPMTSSSQRPGSNIVLSIDTPAAPDGEDARQRPRPRG